MSYIVSLKSDYLIACTIGNHKSGPCKYSTQKTRESMDANRDFLLVNAIKGKISNAKRWEKIARENDVPFAELLPDASKLRMPEFYISEEEL